LENPSIFLDVANENAPLCRHTGDFMQLYITVINDTIEDIRYTCPCNPTANMAAEILCTLIKGKQLDDAVALTEDEFLHFLGSESNELRSKAKALLGTPDPGYIAFQRHVS
jgi:NifU-like protein involved in Fe-S cluster formation